ncbi:MAG TPA: c-type cytochrome [Gaiellaceae bacterium]|nr:c-type cytochrome [Gaiellaceae bacterium]
MRRGTLLLVLLLAGCGTGGLGDAESSSGANGGELFKEKCAGCHELKAAGARGTIGPSLDAAFAASRGEGFDESTIRAVVLGQMRHPIAPMPQPEELFPSAEYSESERDAAMEAIASYVASVAANQQAIAQAGQQAGNASASDPKALFTSNCAGCHTFAAAGTNGKVGPNLDQISLTADRIAEQIRNGGGGMPPFQGQLTDQQIQALAKFVFENRKQ